MDNVAGLKGFSIASIIDCLVPYLAVGWRGQFPEACRNAIVPLRINYAGRMWGCSTTHLAGALGCTRYRQARVP